MTNIFDNSLIHSAPIDMDFDSNVDKIYLFKVWSFLLLVKAEWFERVPIYNGFIWSKLCSPIPGLPC